MRPSRLRPALFALFLLSGFSGLIYESIWTHYLKLILGHAAHAQTLVLAIFMAGMAIGAWLASLRAERIQNPLRIYGLVEGIIGVIGLVFHGLFLWVQDGLYSGVFPAIDSPTLLTLVKWTVCGMMILPQSILLGTTFPMMSAAIIRTEPMRSGAVLGLLYFTNSIGAAMGVLVSTFALIPAMGLPGTMLTASLINIVLAGAVWLLSARRVDPPLPAPEPAVDAASPRLSDLKIMLGVAFFTGLASFFYEIGWIRMLSLVLGSSTHAFELMLAAFIAGLAFGGLWIRRRIDRLSTPLRFLGYVQLIMGALAALTLPLYGSTFDVMASMIQGLAKSGEGYALFNIGSHMIALAVMLPATFMAGTTLPLITLSLIRAGVGEASLGRVYAANTLGSICGVLGAVHLAMPFIGTQGVILAGAAVDVAVGVALLWRVSGHTSRRWEAPVAAATCAVYLLVVGFGVTFDLRKLSAGVYRLGYARLHEEARVTFYQDGKTASIAVLEYPGNLVSIRTNGKSDASIVIEGTEYSDDELTMVLAAALPLALLGKAQSRQAANIGFGSGLTTHALLGVDSLERVDSIEIEPAMIEGARLFGKAVARAYSDPRSHIIIDDAKSYFSARKARYDLIISEPSNPWVSGVASLFTDEFYQRVLHYLQPGGLFVQWIQVYEINHELMSSVFAALDANFADYSVFHTNDADLLIVASPERPLPAFDPWIFAQPALGADLARLGVRSVADLEFRRLGTKASLGPYFRSLGAPMNSDFFPFVSYHAPRSRFLQEQSGDLGQLHVAPVPVLELLGVTTNAHLADLAGSQHFSKIEKRKQALAITKALAAPPSTAPPGLPLDLSFAVLVLREAVITCRLTPTGGSVEQGLWKLGEETLPYLSPTELTAMWQSIDASPCLAVLPAGVTAWLDLLRAVSARDAANMVVTGQRLLATAGALPVPETRDYAVAATALGLIASQRRPEALQLLDAHLTRATAKPPFYLRYLAALAADVPAEPTTAP